MNSHEHGFRLEDWPFAVPIATATYCTGRVAKDRMPILHVSHDDEGDWQFLDGTTEEPEDCTLLCFGCVFEMDSRVGELADLPRGWMAWRDSPGHPWHRYERPAE
jgi:hypothetical protein